MNKEAPYPIIKSVPLEEYKKILDKLTVIQTKLLLFEAGMGDYVPRPKHENYDTQKIN